MFNQTFVDGTQKTRRPYTIFLSLLCQLFALGILILIPLVFTKALPNAQLKNLLVAPSPPRPTPPQPPVEKKAPKVAVSQFHAGRLLAPRVIPKQVNPIQDSAPAPDIVMPNAANGGFEPGVTSLLNSTTGEAPPPPTKIPAPKPTSGPMKIGGNVAEANLVHRVQPIYPPLAKSARIQGTVEFTAIISKEGNIEHLQLVRGHPLLVNAASEAVKQWKYKPTLLNGQPVEVLTDIFVYFTLSSL